MMRLNRIIYQPLLLSVQLAAFHCSKKTVTLPVVENRGSSSSAISCVHTGNILAIEFSTDKSFIVSWSADKTVSFFGLCNVATEETQTTTSVHQMRTKHESIVNWVVISSVNCRIFSGGFDSHVQFQHFAALALARKNSTQVSLMFILLLKRLI